MAGKHKGMKIPIIVGPTSTGKTSLAIWLCKKLGGEIISADSRQVYRYMDVGTGKIPLDFLSNLQLIGKPCDYSELDGAKIWGYDLVLPGEYFSAHDFASYGLVKVQELREKCVLPLLVGGTGLYIDFFTGKYKDSYDPPNFKLRAELELKSLEDLQKHTTSLNIEVNYSDFHNKRRLVRIIERSVSVEKETPLPYSPSSEYVFLGLTSSHEYLYKRADVWVDSIWADNLVLREVDKLCSLGFGATSQINGLIYKDVFKYRQGLCSRDEAVQKIKYGVHAYIRRQQTYFRRNKNIHWFDVAQDNLYENVYNYLMGVLNG